MKGLVSVIVPIYNVEKYLKRCVESICSQTYKNLEIILVDDGSPDNCPRICEELAKVDERIKVIHKKNGGLSDARNCGLDNCSGKYVCFVDSDDCIEKDYVEHMLTIAEDTDADMVISSFKYLYEDGSTKDFDFEFEKKYLGPKECMELLTRDYKLPVVVAWSKLYKREIFSELRFKKGIIHEDEEICHKIISLINKISLTNKCLYLYFQRNDSIMGTLKPAKSKVMNEILAERKEFAVKIGCDDECLKNFEINRYQYSFKLAYLFNKEKDKINYRKQLVVIKDNLRELQSNKLIKRSAVMKYYVKYYLLKFHLYNLLLKVRR